LGGVTYSFVSWSDGGSQTHLVTGTTSASYTATYSAAAATPPPSTTAPANGGGGGCTLDRLGTGDALLPTLFIVVLALLLVRTKRRANEADRTLP
jgi:hypothetical protein